MGVMVGGSGSGSGNPNPHHVGGRAGGRGEAIALVALAVGERHAIALDEHVAEDAAWLGLGLGSGLGLGLGLPVP